MAGNEGHARATITVRDDAGGAERLVVDQGLGESNAAAAPLHEVQALSCFAYLHAGELAGGAVGRTWGGGAELQQLWVAPAQRRRGIGGQLLRAFARAAQARGCHTLYLETFSFQAPAFYRAHGFEVVLALDCFGAGIVKYTLLRRL